MADPIMDLFDDPNLFGLDPLSDEAQDPIEEALGLAGGLDPPPHPKPLLPPHPPKPPPTTLQPLPNPPLKNRSC